MSVSLTTLVSLRKFFVWDDFLLDVVTNKCEEFLNSSAMLSGFVIDFP